jgi:hypothetical protein
MQWQRSRRRAARTGGGRCRRPRDRGPDWETTGRRTEAEEEAASRTLSAGQPPLLATSRPTAGPYTTIMTLPSGALTSIVQAFCGRLLIVLMPGSGLVSGLLSAVGRVAVHRARG